MDKFLQLVEDLNNNKLGMKHIQNALRVHTRERKTIPDGIKDLLAGSSGGLMPASGLIRNIFKFIDEVEGALELAYRRGYQAGEENYKELLLNDEEEYRKFKEKRFKVESAKDYKKFLMEDDEEYRKIMERQSNSR